MKRFTATITFNSENIDEALKKLEKSILRKTNKLVLCEANDIVDEIWYNYEEQRRD